VEGEREASTVLRTGTLAGLGLLIIGLGLQYLTSCKDLPYLGLWLIVATPPTALATLAANSLRSDDIKSFALALLMLCVIILSSIILASHH
jgi:hypothetical protein